MKAHEIKAMLNALDLAGFLPVAMLIVSIGATWLAGNEVYKSVLSIRQDHVNESALRVEIQKSPLTMGEYKTLTESLARLHPTVKFTVENNKGIRIEIAQAAAYPEWMQALSVIHARQPGVIWDVKEFCVGRCGSAAATANIEGIRQSAAIKG